MTANLVREPNTGSWIRVETAEAGVVRAYCACGTVPEPCLTQLHEGHGTAWRVCGLRLRSQQLGTKMYSRFDQILAKIGQCRAWSPGHLVLWSFGPHLSRG